MWEVQFKTCEGTFSGGPFFAETSEGSLREGEQTRDLGCFGSARSSLKLRRAFFAPLRSAKNGGEGGIRTHGGLRLFGFQDRRDRPLCHLSWLLRTRGYLRWRCVVAKWKFDWCGCLIVGGFGIPMGDACFDCGG